MPEPGKSLNDIEQEIRSAFDSQFRKESKEEGEIPGAASPYIRSIFLDDRFVVAEKGGKQYKIPFGEDYKFAEENSWEEGSLRSEWAGKAAKVDPEEEETEIEVDEDEAESREMAKDLQYAK
jgi:hypothetical protein